MFDFHLTGVLIGLLAFTGASVAALAVGVCLNRRADRAEAGATSELPTRQDHVDAMWALACASPVYVSQLLGLHESELTDLAELVLELDDNAPRTAGD